MNRYVIRRLVLAIPTLLAISLIIFAVLALAPNDPMSQFALNPAVPPEVRENIRHSLGLDQPWPIRYVKWLTTLVTQGNLGYSFASHLPVTTVILQRLPTTLWVIGISYMLSILLAIPLGVISAVKQYSIFDHISTTVAFIGFSLPTFFTGLILIIIFGIRLKWFPWIYDSTIQVKDADSLLLLLKQSVLPITVLALFETATLMRYVRASMLESLPQDYVRTARAKGLAERAVVIGHVFRNSMIPVVTLIALGIPAIFTGALITEQIFRVPGIGSLLVSSFNASDTPVIMGVTFIFAILVVLFNVIVDVLYGFLDPRIKYS
ncbi:MAG TPA: ABC transporter permease [Anaerolineae bacterium]|nr:ABC transporter permease [Anaerolineae bacterium]